MKKIIIDFETRSEIDLRKVGPWVYAEHPSTEILCIGYKIGKHSNVAVHKKFLEGLYRDYKREDVPFWPDILSDFDLKFVSGPFRETDPKWSGPYIFEAHNAEFERAIWHHICHKRWGWPDIPIERWRCSAAKAAALSLPRDLDRLGKVLNAPILKDPAGHRLMLQMCKPRRPRKAEKIKWLENSGIKKSVKTVTDGIGEVDVLGFAEQNMPVLWKEDKESLIKLFEYCIRDVEAEHCVSELMRDLSPKEQKLWFIDQRINQRGVKIDKPSIEAIIEIVEKPKARMQEELREITHGTIQTIGQGAKIEAWAATKGFKLENLQKETIKNILDKPQTIQRDKNLLEYNIWSEGFKATGEEKGVSFEGRVYAKTLQEACDKLAILENWQEQYNSEKRTWHGCKLFHGKRVEYVDGFRPKKEKPLKIHPQVRRVLEIRQALNKSSVAKFDKLYISSNADERCRGLLMYHGAGTGRFSGKRFQPQNLPRPEFKDVGACLEVIRERDIETLEMLWGDTTRVVSSCIRGVLIPEEGKEFICGDFSSIEASIIGWYANEKKVLRAFAEKLDIYKVAAMDIYHTSYDKVATEQRRIGKVAVLALGFGGGVAAFQQMAPGYGVYVPDEQAEDIKTKWREAHPKIVQFWYDTENTVKKVIKTGRTMQMQKGLKWGLNGDFLFCKLPSGRLMAYYQPMIRPKKTPWGQMKDTVSYMAMDSMTNQWRVHYSYGGKLVENIVQATARDLLTDAIVRVEEAGYPVVLHVHDEILSEVFVGDIKTFESLMAKTPPWAEGCPISVEAWRGQRYRK
jgi:DNA polymerase